MTRTLVFGGARSGKSAFAEQLAQQSNSDVTYIATARGADGEMSTRIAHHRARRPAHWATLEEPLLLAAAIDAHCTTGRVVLVDCLTLWLSNLIFSDGRHYPEVGDVRLPPLFDEQRAALLAALATARGDIVLVSNEVGMGIVPMGAVSRAFTDEAGRLNQAVAAACDKVVFVAAGLPLHLKGAPCSSA